jgi:4-amino-4-deoxy-L-arabinose transferase-like glycosyltransferase
MRCPYIAAPASIMTQPAPRSQPGSLVGYLLPVSIALLAWALYLYRLEFKSLWFDELGTLYDAGWGASWLEAIRRPLAVPIMPKPPLYFVLTRLFLALGDQVFLLRLPAALLAMLTVPLVFALGRALFNRQVGLVAALLLAVSPLQIRYAQEARMYAALMFLCTLSLFLLWRALHSARANWWFAFALAATAALYTHLLALIPLAVMALFALVQWMRAQRTTPISFQPRHFVAALAVIAVAYSPIIPFLVEGLVGAEGLGGPTAPGWTMAHLVGTLRLFGAGSNLGAALYALLALCGLTRMAKQRHEATHLLAFLAVAPVVVLLIVPFGHRLYVRYFLAALPIYLLAVAYGLQGVVGWLLAGLSRTWGPHQVRTTTITIVLVAVATALAAIGIPSLVTYYVEAKQNWRDATWLVQDLASPGDKVFVRHPCQQAGILFYAGQRKAGPDFAQDVQVLLLPRDPSAPFPLAHDETGWLVVPLREGFLPDGEFDANVLTRHDILSPTQFRVANRPPDWPLIAQVAFRTVAVIPVVPSPLPTISMWADSARVAVGECTWLRWQADHVREVYLNGEGVVGHDARQVCPAGPTSYQLEAVLEDGSHITRTVEITVETP